MNNIGLNMMGWVIFGSMVSLIISSVDTFSERRNNGESIILGILGALISGTFANLILGAGVTGFTMTSFVVAILGAAFVLYINRSLSEAS